MARGALGAWPALQELDLSHNRIDVVHALAFEGLRGLKRLSLAHNRVVEVAGWRLPQLSHLSLADNALRCWGDGPRYIW